MRCLFSSVNMLEYHYVWQIYAVYNQNKKLLFCLSCLPVVAIPATVVLCSFYLPPGEHFLIILSDNPPNTDVYHPEQGRACLPCTVSLDASLTIWKNAYFSVWFPRLSPRLPCAPACFIRHGRCSQTNMAHQYSRSSYAIGQSCPVVWTGVVRQV